jgi:hypothetical protein
MNPFKAGVAVAALVAAVSGWVWQYRVSARLQRELGAAREQAGELRPLRAGTARLEKLRADEGVELAKLRDEIATLKTRLQETSRAAALMPPNARGADSPARFTLATGLKPVESLTNAGKGSARAALETRLWATQGGDTGLIIDTMMLPPETRQKAEELFAKMSEAARARYRTPEELLAAAFAGAGGVQTAGMQVLGERAGARSEGMAPELQNDPAYRTLRVQTQYSNGMVRENDLVFQLGADGWREVIQPNTVVKAAAVLGKRATPKPKPDGP